MTTSIRERLVHLVHVAETYLKTDLSYLLRGGFWSTVSQVASALASLAFSVVVSRYVTKTAYGDYKYILSVVSLLSFLSLNDLGSAVLQSTASGYDGALQEGFRMNLRWSILVFFGSFALCAYYLFAHNTILALGILIGGCFSPFMGSVNLGISFLSGKKDLRRGALYFGILGNIIPSLALIITALFTTNPLFLVIMYFLSNFLADLYFYLCTLRIYRPDPKKKDPAMLSYGKHLSAIGVLGGVASNIDQILLFHFLGPAEVAVYNFALGVLGQIKGPLKGLDSMIQARFAGHTDKNISQNINNKMLLALIGSALFVACYIIVAPWLYRFLFPTYIDAVPYSQLYAFSFLSLMFAAPASYLSAKKKVRELYISSIIISTFQVAAMVVGIVWWGLWGLMAARVATQFLGGAVGYIFYRTSISHEH